jgi:hypothetical protein
MSRHSNVNRVRIPDSLPDAVRWVFNEHLVMPEAYSLSPSDIAALRGLRPIRHYDSGFVRVDAGELARVRQLCEIELRELEPECDNGACGTCERCRVSLLADRIDYWLNSPNPAVGQVPSVELAWEHMFGGVVAV